MAKGYTKRHTNNQVKAGRPSAGPQPWRADNDGRVIVKRDALFWKPGGGRSVDCSLCYRNCHIPPGEAGWCRIRRNERGRMTLTAHGVLSEIAVGLYGYQNSPFATYRPGARFLNIGGVACTSHCAFCFSMAKALNPDTVPWAAGERRTVDRLFTGYRAIIHPLGLITAAKKLGCTEISFSVNEPVLNYEYTLDTSYLAKKSGLGVSLLTNGFSSPDPVRKLAGLVDAVDVGVKGSGDPAFYDRWMQAAGGMDAVRQSLLEWKRAGVYMLLSDVIAPPHMQTDDEFEQSAENFYSWVRDELGEQTVITILTMQNPVDYFSGDPFRLGLFLPDSPSLDTVTRYLARIQRAEEICKDIGLPYASANKEAPVVCHHCGGELIRLISPRVNCEPCVMAFEFCPHWRHEQHVTAGRCDHCGAAVPIVTQTPAELAATRRFINSLPHEQTVIPA